MRFREDVEYGKVRERVCGGAGEEDRDMII